MTEYYDVALFINSKANLKTVHGIFNALEDEEIYVIPTSLDFQNDALYFEAQTPYEDVTEIIDRIHRDWGWIKIDWDTMRDWEPETE